MKLMIQRTAGSTADGIYTVKATGGLAALLYWADDNGRLSDWTAFAYIPIQPNGEGTCVLQGGRAIPKDATHVYAEVMDDDLTIFEWILEPICDFSRMITDGYPKRFFVLSDCHLSKKPWIVRNALRMAKDADCILLTGDMTNDGTPAEMSLIHQCITDILPSKPVFTVAGNHDFPITPMPQVDEGVCNYYRLQEKFLQNVEELGWDVELDSSGAYAASWGDIEIIGLNATSHWWRFVFRHGRQLAWLEQHLEKSSDKRHIVLCHAPLIAYNPQRPSDGQPYLNRDSELQKIIDKHQNIIFLSGHTHISVNCCKGCAEQGINGNIYINAGSIRPTTLKTKEGLQVPEWTEGNGIELLLYEDLLRVTGVSLKLQKKISRCFYEYDFCRENIFKS